MGKTRLGVVSAATFGAVLAMAGPAAAAGDPPGNNGTVKIDGVAFDDHPDNEPHVGCTFQVDFYGFDAGEDLEASVTFEAVPPTAGGDEPLLTDTVDIGEDAAGGGTDLDASATYDLTDALAGIEPHAQQGWHVKLTVHADGSQGADTKHKVFWVEGCGPTTSSSTTTPGSSSTVPDGSSTTATPGSSSTVPDGTTPSTPPSSTPPSSGPDASTPTTGEPPDAAPTTVPTGAEGDLPRTGSSTVPVLVGALALIALGLGGVAGARALRVARH
jgi:hypothetical protein